MKTIKGSYHLTNRIARLDSSSSLRPWSKSTRTRVNIEVVSIPACNNCQTCWFPFSCLSCNSDDGNEEDDAGGAADAQGKDFRRPFRLSLCLAYDGIARKLERMKFPDIWALAQTETRKVTISQTGRGKQGSGRRGSQIKSEPKQVTYILNKITRLKSAVQLCLAHTSGTRQTTRPIRWKRTLLAKQPSNWHD